MKVWQFTTSILFLASVVSCDSDSLGTKNLVTDHRSGLRARDLPKVDSNEPLSSEGGADATAAFAVVLRGKLPPETSGAGDYEVYIVSPEAKTYRSSIERDEAPCSMSEELQLTDVGTPIAIKVTDEGAYTLCVEAYDPSGKASSLFSYAWVVDLQKPDITILNAPEGETGLSSITLKITSDAAKAYRFARNNGTKDCSDESYGAEYSLTTGLAIQPSADGKARVCVKSIREGGVESDPAMVEWTYVDSLPSFSLSGLPSVVTVGKTSQPIEFAADSALATYQWSLQKGISDCKAAAMSAALPMTTAIPSGLGVPGYNTLCIKGATATGAVGPIFHYVWEVDPVGAAITITGLPESDDGKDQLSITVGGQGIVEFQYALLHEDDGECTYKGYKPFQPVATKITDKLELGGYSLCIIGKDSNGNSSSALEFKWNRIKMPPVSFAVASGLPSLVTNETAFTGITVNTQNAEAFKFGFKVGDLECEMVPLGMPISPTDTIDFSLGANPANGKYTFCAIGIGHFGQLSKTYRYQFEVDTVKPDLKPLQQSGADDSQIEISVSLNNEELLGASYRYYSILVPPGDQTPCDQAGTATYAQGPKPIAEKAKFDLPGPGEIRRVCVFAEDKATNRSEVQSTEIVPE